MSRKQLLTKYPVSVDEGEAGWGTHWPVEEGEAYLLAFYLSPLSLPRLLSPVLPTGHAAWKGLGEGEEGPGSQTP